MDDDPHHRFDERAAGLAMLGTIIFCTIIGAGVGVFYEVPVFAAIAGALVGIVLGWLIVPRLMRDWID